MKSYQIRHRFPEVDRRRYKGDGMSSHGGHRILSGRQRALPLSQIQGHIRPKQGTLRPTNRPLRPTQRPLRPTDDPLEPKKTLVDRKRVSSGRQRNTRRWFLRPIKDCLMPKKMLSGQSKQFYVKQGLLRPTNGLRPSQAKPSQTSTESRQAGTRHSRRQIALSGHFVHRAISG